GRLLCRGSECGDCGNDKSLHAKTGKTCANILAILPAYFTCCYHEGVEPTNNTSERALRHPVQWRRTSFGTQSEAGSRFVERILSTVETCRRQGLNVLGFLTKAVTARLSGSSVPSLLPVPSG
ncbi:transposase, partial [bacterium]|nr:transposase [bacterium]